MIRRRAALASIVFAVAAGVPPAAALEFGFEPAARFGGSAGLSVMTLRGEIEVGDFARLRRFIAASERRWLDDGEVVVPVIDGGDIEEAKAIGAFLREAMSVMRLPDAGSSRCVSACLFVLAQAVERHALAGTVGVHRPYFDSAALSGASPEAARRRYAGLLGALRGELTEWDVPQSLTERMFATPSSSMHWLTAEDLDQLGNYAPWFAEYAAARCGLDPQAGENLAQMRALGDESGAAALAQAQQQAGACLSLQRRQQRQRLLDSAGPH